MTPAAILALINQYIVSNGVGGITGPILNSILTSIVNLFTTGSVASARIVTASTTLTVLLTDQSIGLQRNFGLSAMIVQLPSGILIGQQFTIEDLVGNLQAYPATVTPPPGHAIAGLPTYVMNEDRQSSTFRYYGASVWSVS